MIDLEKRMARIEGLILAIESSTDERTRDAARELTQALLELHAGALEKMLDLCAAAGPPGVALAEASGRDPLVAAVLHLHGLHPVPVEARVREALAAARRELAAHGAEVVLRGVEDGVARLRLDGPAGMRRVIEQAVAAAAPDLAGVEIEGGDEAPVAPPPLVALRVRGKEAR